MKLIIKYLSLSILIVFSQLILQKLFAQDFEETLKFADYQFSSGKLTEASKTFQRALFFSEGRQNLYIFRKIAEISYLRMDYESAQKYYGLAYNLSDDESLKTELLFDKASCQILNKNYQNALIDLFSVNDTSDVIQRRLNFFLGTCYFGLEDFSRAEKYFESCTDLKDRKELAFLFSGKKLLSPSPKKARIMSMILPGLGQTYSGDIKSGLNSLFLTSGLIALGIKISISYSPIDAIFAILPWYQRYYTGGYGKAEDIARKRLEQKRNSTYTRILKLADRNPND
jgi:tetratricopeptide (TPR) repeat protein